MSDERCIASRLILRFCALLIVALGSTEISAQTVSATGSWSFDEGSGPTTSDASGNGNTGTLVNGPVWTTGYSGSALSFNRDTRYVDVNGGGTLANLHSAGMTITAWVKPVSGGGSAARVVDKNNNTTGWFLAMNGGGLLEFVGDSFTTGVVRRTASSALAMNTWQHVAVSWDGLTNSSNVHIYINGVLSDGAGANGSGTPRDDSSVPFAIGNRSIDAARGFKGVIDEVRVYSQVLSATDIQATLSGDTQAPSAPSALTATAASGTQINLSWTAATDDVGVTGYLVERCQGASCSNFTQIATPTSTTSFSDTALAVSTSYSYRVRARDAIGNLSIYSPVASASTSAPSDTQAPSVPSGLAATAVSTTQINLSWTASTDNVGVTGYQVERCQGGNCSNFIQVATSTATAFSDTGLIEGLTLRYRISSRDAANNLSPYSNEVEVTTESPLSMSVVITHPANNATAIDRNTLVTGVFNGPLYGGVSINGVPATLAGDVPQRTFAAVVPLNVGDNIVSVVGSEPGGAVAESQIHVIRFGSTPFAIVASPGRWRGTARGVFLHQKV